MRTFWSAGHDVSRRQQGRVIPQVLTFSLPAMALRGMKQGMKRGMKRAASAGSGRPAKRSAGSVLRICRCLGLGPRLGPGASRVRSLYSGPGYNYRVSGTPWILVYPGANIIAALSVSSISQWHRPDNRYVGLGLASNS